VNVLGGAHAARLVDRDRLEREVGRCPRRQSTLAEAVLGVRLGDEELLLAFQLNTLESLAAAHVHVRGGAEVLVGGAAIPNDPQPAVFLGDEERLDSGVALRREADEAKFDQSVHEPGTQLGVAAQHLVKVGCRDAFSLA